MASAVVRMISCACFFVPTNSTCLPRATVSLRNAEAACRPSQVRSRLMTWIPLRTPKMYGFIFGFQRLV
jgi:hypothetical protein